MAKSEVYMVLCDHVTVLLDVVTCVVLGDYILHHNPSDPAILAFARQLCKNKRHRKAQEEADRSGEYEAFDQDQLKQLERMRKSAFLKVGRLNEYTLPILLDEDFCIALGRFIETNGTNDATVRRIGRRLLQAKEFILKRNIESVKSRRKKGESFQHIGKELGISAATASRYSKL